MAADAAIGRRPGDCPDRDGQPAEDAAATHLVAAVAYKDGRKVADIALAEAGQWMRSGHFVWIGLFQPAAAVLRDLQAQFDLHELAVEDALSAHQRPKVEVFGTTILVVVRTAQMIGEAIGFGQTLIFVGQGFVISVRHGASCPYWPVRARCEAMPTMLAHGEDYVLYAILDFIVDNYAPVLEAVEDRAAALERRIVGGRSLAQEDIDRLYRLRRQLLRLRRSVAPLADVCALLERTRLPMIDKAIRPYFRDVMDHVLRVNDEVVALGEIVTFTFEASMMIVSLRQTEVTRRLAAWAAILAVPTAVAGIYGMNFDFMPELQWRYGYFAVLGVIAATCGFLYWRFRRSGWI
jgi:magnesium transporter